ncbi:MAG: radical SAM protein [Candidatus Latescibacteria bacterium]|nr:radical SAM protein [bacterium]MBD3425012.1 radical SAM protein [Candidatus Latescibacterota bacterium]
MESEPSYLGPHRRGDLAALGRKLHDMMSECRLCPRECLADRISGERGFCGADSELVISSAHPHFGEESGLVGSGGSGTIFFSNCSLRCAFCINWQISHRGDGSRRSIRELAGMMLRLQETGCHNINVVTPTHYLPHILLALDIAAGEGLNLPLAYNTCGWERTEILRELDGIVDIYLPDFKYFSGEMAAKYSAGAGEYPEITRAALLEMNRQVGTARPGEDGLIRRGLMIRHLVMPNNVGGSVKVMEWIAENLPGDTYVNIMSQYRPMYRAGEYPEISRRIYRSEYLEVIRAARGAGLTNLDIQG